MKTNSTTHPLPSIFQAILLIVVLLSSVSSFAKEKTTTLLVWGDSLSAAYGMPVEKGWVNLLRKKHAALNIVNGSISGETTRGGLTRLPEALKQHKPDIVILELGANDGLRGFPVATMQNNLESMIKAVQKNDAKVILAGMKVPPNYGFKYADAFEKVYQDLAEKYAVALIPFFLDGVADNFDLVQADGLHPTVEAQKIILQTVEPFVEKLL